MRWLQETHGTRFELLRHFLAHFFESEMVSDPDELRKALIGFFAALASLGIVVLQTFSERYDVLQSAVHSSAAIYRHELRADQLLFIGIAMGVTALLTVLHWQALFPSLRDCLALAGLPIGVSEIFVAKFGALLLVFGVFVVAANLPWAILFASAASGHWQENPSALANVAANFAATAGACIFVFFSLAGLEGLLLNVLPARLFARVSLWVQGLIFIATVGAMPLVARQPVAPWWPGAWFLHLWEAIITGRARESYAALTAMFIPAVISFGAYLASYGQHRRVLLESSPGHGTARWPEAGSWLLERWIPDPREQAAFAFLWKSLARSSAHRLLLLAYAGLALGWITKGALDMPVPSLRDEGLYGMLVTVSPLALALLVTVALRYLFSLPVALPANWIFRVLDRDGHAAWLRAVERFVVWCGIAPVFVASLPASVAILGWGRAGAVTLLSFLTALLWFELLFRKWRKLGFTCSYLPGRRPAAVTLVRYGIGAPLLVSAGAGILYCSIEPAAFLALLSVQIAMYWRQRGKRLKAWEECSLVYEDVLPAEVSPLDLGEYVHAEGPQVSVPARTTETFRGALTASRGILPVEWAEELAEARGDPFFASIYEDIRLGFRLMRRNAMASLMIVATLTAGIGINASVYTVVNGLAMRPHVYKDPGSFVRIIAETQSNSMPRALSSAEYMAYREARSLRQLAAWADFTALIGDADSIGTNGLAVSCNFFAVDGLDRPVLGRLFIDADCQNPGQPAVAVISETVWRTRFGRDPDLIGKTIRLNDRPVPVVGIVPDRTAGWTRGAATGVWIPYTSQPYFDSTRNLFRQDDYLWLQLAGRLATGVAAEQARLEILMLARRQDRLIPGRITTIVTTDGSWMQQMELTLSGRSLMLIAFFFGTFNLVLLIACANVSTLLLSRAVSRQREISIRLSLGAPRLRLVRMLLTESLLLAAMAGAVSAYLVWIVPAPLARTVVTSVPEFSMSPDWSIFAYISVAVMLTGVLAGLAPAFESIRMNSRNSTRRTLGVLVGVQVALSMVLLVGSGLLGQAENRNLRGNPGYLPDRVVVMPVRFPHGTDVKAAQVRLQAIEQRMQQLPGVRSVTLSDSIPLFNADTVELHPPGREDAVQPVDIFSASPRFLETMGIPLVRGREFQASDRAAVIVSESLARAFWKRRDPLGESIELTGGAAVVVGVAKDVEPMRFGGSDNPALYRLRESNALRNVMSVRFDSGARRGPAAVRAAMRDVEPGIPVGPQLMQAHIERLTADLWNFVSLILILGMLGTALSTAGIYGAVSFSVNQGMRELGIRMALGARKVDIFREVFVSGGRPAFHGLVAGIWLSVATAAGLRAVLGNAPIRIDSSDPLLYAGAAFLLAIAAVAAMVAPARRGSQSNPAVVLRCE